MSKKQIDHKMVNFLKCQETTLAWGENAWIRGRSSALFVWICCALNVQLKCIAKYKNDAGQKPLILKVPRQKQGQFENGR